MNSDQREKRRGSALAIFDRRQSAQTFSLRRSSSGVGSTAIGFFGLGGSRRNSTPNQPQETSASVPGSPNLPPATNFGRSFSFKACQKRVSWPQTYLNYSKLLCKLSFILYIIKMHFYFIKNVCQKIEAFMPQSKNFFLHLVLNLLTWKLFVFSKSLRTPFTMSARCRFDRKNGSCWQGKSWEILMKKKSVGITKQKKSSK